MKKRIPDEGLFPPSGGEALDKAGIQDSGYLNKNRVPSKWSCDSSGVHGEILNRLPPGMNIEDQHLSMAETAAKRLAKVKEVDEIGYPEDGWQSKP